MSRTIGIALVALLVGGAAHAETLAFTGGTVHPVSGPSIANGTVVVTDGRITQVGAGLAPPPGARVVDLAGKHLYPGIVSAMSVLGLVEVNTVRGSNDWQETGKLNPNIRAEVGFNAESEMIPVARLNGITTTLVIPRGEAVTGTSALMAMDGWNWEDMTAKSGVALHVVWPNMTPVAGATTTDEQQRKARDASIDVIRNAFLDAGAYWRARNAERLAGIPRHDRDAKWDAFGRALRGEIPVAFHADQLNQIRAVLSFVDEHKLSRVILVGGDDAAHVADELKARNIAVISGGTLEVPRRRWEAYDEAYARPARLFRAGLRYAISDGGSAFTAMNARNLPYHAAMAVAYGLPREEALKAITLHPAEILGVADQVGSIQPGRRADFMVTDGDPLEYETTIEQVWVGGTLTSSDNRQTRLWKRYDNRPRGELARKR
jgi:imidazolonepropionase-like amidohydrolase